MAGRSEAVREHCPTLLPTQLDEGELVAALEELARRSGAGGLVDRVVPPGSVTWTPSTRSPYVAAGALLNVHQHNSAPTTPWYRRTSTTAGIDGDAIRGIGLQEMRERADALSGGIDVGPGRCGIDVRLVPPSRKRIRWTGRCGVPGDAGPIGLRTSTPRRSLATSAQPWLVIRYIV